MGHYKIEEDTKELILLDLVRWLVFYVILFVVFTLIISYLAEPVIRLLLIINKVPR